jgi:PAS domain S-box-containing protein
MPETSSVPPQGSRQILEREKEVVERLQSQRGFLHLWELASDALILVDDRGQIVLANGQIERMFGYPREELLGRSIEMLIPLRFRSRHLGHRADFFANPRARPMGTGLELFGLRKDGSEFPVDINLSVLTTDEGLLVKAAIRDVSERKRAQERLRHFAEELQQSNLELQQFAYVASHDLQEPLRAVATFCEMLQRRYQGKLDADGNQWLGFVITGARRMQALVQDLLAYSRLENRGQPLVAIACDDVAEKAVSALQSAIADAGASVTWDALPTIQGDASQLVQLFQNLIGNAIKFRGPEPPRVHISATPQGDNWLFSVRDNGIGIDPKFHERIFEIFKRLHTADRYPGTGIGLAICRKVVARHGGRIWIQSELGSGSTFCFTMPNPGAPTAMPESEGVHSP